MPTRKTFEKTDPNGNILRITISIPDNMLPRYEIQINNGEPIRWLGRPDDVIEFLANKPHLRSD